MVQITKSLGGLSAPKRDGVEAFFDCRDALWDWHRDVVNTVLYVCVLPTRPVVN